jgi:hypothetical protein
MYIVAFDEHFVMTILLNMQLVNMKFLERQFDISSMNVYG